MIFVYPNSIKYTKPNYLYNHLHLDLNNQMIINTTNSKIKIVLKLNIRMHRALKMKIRLLIIKTPRNYLKRHIEWLLGL